ncbi:670_t:CDS:1 [Dentiscutata heterogama]|uniref:670_t:CDS:1 n=1 Tax=Dentiscutata heterogama TaxID=1316150 RepID=A0ACA9NSA5_9GLOM|nr:670_t:CDS:1 [Dentiscutata heterogama]
MKFLSILATFLVFIIVIAHAVPIERKLGPNAHALAEKIRIIYWNNANDALKIYQSYDKEIKDFDNKIKQAAKEDGTDEKTVEWLTKWNENYGELAKELKSSSAHLLSAIDKLKTKLGD